MSRSLRTSFLLRCLPILAASLLLWNSSVLAQQGAANLFREVQYSVSGNAAIVNDYLFRGESLSDGKPAVQGGFDYTGGNNLYIGAWGTSGSRKIPVEFDLYTGYTYEVTERFGAELAVTAYLYPHVMDDSTWEVKVGAHGRYTAVAYNYDFVLRKHYPEMGFRGPIKEWLDWRVRVGLSYQSQGNHSRPGRLVQVDVEKTNWDGDVQLIFLPTEELFINVGVAHHEEHGTTPMLGVKTEFEFLSWRGR